MRKTVIDLLRRYLSISGTVTIIQRMCNSCGKNIFVHLDENKNILFGGIYWGITRLGVGMWHSHKMIIENGRVRWVKTISRWKELKYKLIDLKRTILHQYIDAEYWECKKCYDEGVERAKKKMGC